MRGRQFCLETAIDFFMSICYNVQACYTNISNQEKSMIQILLFRVYLAKAAQKQYLTQSLMEKKGAGGAK